MGGVVWSQTAHSVGATPPVETPNETVDVRDDDASEAERKLKLEREMQAFKEEMDKKREARKEAIQNLNKRIVELQEERDKERSEKMKLEEELESMRKSTRKEAKMGKAAGVDKTAAAKKDEECEGNSNTEHHDDQNEVTTVQKSEEGGSESENHSAATDQRPDVDESDTGNPGQNDEFDDQDKDEVIEGLERQVKALKDVAMIGGEMLRIRELQVNELKSKLEAIEETGIAYEKEVENMKKLRNLYEERARAMTISHEMELEREKQKALAAETRQKLAEHKNLELEEKNKEIEERMGKIEGELDEAKMQISDLKIKLAGKSEDLYNANSQLAVVNHLFGQLFSPGQDSLEKITKVLEEHHDLVNHLTANGKINELASTLVEIADKDPLPGGEGEHDMSGHLTKVWRLLVELLGHHIAKPAPEEASPESCYKSVDTPSGPKLVISVSQTFLRLKDLILEKNSLMKEVGRLKDLNFTLESRLLEQESRLSLVTTELHSTWGVVNKLKRQHQNLHSHEQVLRYELAQKRLLLNELKKQLEECKDIWSLARAKNNQTEKDWKLLRSEFALRKQQASSAESGYEESPTDSQDEEEWKEEKKLSVSSNEDHCEVLSWNDSEGPRTERRGTLTDASQNDATPRGYVNFNVDNVDSCVVLPWTEPEESSAENSISEDGRNSEVSQEFSVAERIPSMESPESVSLLGECSSGSIPGISSLYSDPGSSADHCGAYESRLVGSSLEDGASTSAYDHQSRYAPYGTESRLSGAHSGSQSSSQYTSGSVEGSPSTISSSVEPLSSRQRTTEEILQAGQDRLSSSSSEPSSSRQRTAEEILQAGQDQLSSSSAEPSSSRQRTAEEILEARQERLQRLEEGCKGLFSKMSKTNQRSEVIKSRLTELHEIYGEDSRARRDLTTDRTESSVVTTQDTAPGSAPPSPADEIQRPHVESILNVESTPNPEAAPEPTTSTPPTPPPFPPHPLYSPPQQQHPSDSNR